MTLSDFLLARIAEEETEATWFLRLHNGPKSEPETDERVIAMLDILAGLHTKQLAECEAKRRIVEALSHYAGTERRPTGRPGVYDVAFIREPNWEGDADIVLPLLALPYADHPDYREDWRP